MIADGSLLEAWRAGDTAAGDELLGRHFDSVLRFFRSKLGDEVDDLAQRTFLDCIESRDRVAQDNFRGYLFGVARHRLVDHLRHQQRRGDKTDFLTTSVADLRTSASQRLAKNQEEALLMLAMRHIPLEFQIAIELAYWEEMSGREIAYALDIPENTVRSRLSRGRKLLRDQVGKLAHSPALAGSTLHALASK